MTLDGHHMAPETLWNDPTQRGFESVFKPDYDFALILQRLRTFYSSQKGVRLKHEGLRSTLEEASSCPVFVAVSQDASSR